jgi:hypothetical protein
MQNWNFFLVLFGDTLGPCKPFPGSGSSALNWSVVELVPNPPPGRGLGLCVCSMFAVIFMLCFEGMITRSFGGVF